MPRLSKHAVERLLDAYDNDPIEALTEALTAVEADSETIRTVSTMSTAQHDALLRDLVEWRGVTPPDL